MLLASGLKLLGASTTTLVVVLASVAVVGPVLWATVYRRAGAGPGAPASSPALTDRCRVPAFRAGTPVAPGVAVTADEPDRAHAGPKGHERHG